MRQLKKYKKKVERK